MIIIVMGVSGCGKSTIAELIANSLGASYLDADDLHPPENKERMSAGIPLTDENRWPWLRKVREAGMKRSSSGQPSVIACSALKKSYRDVLNEAPNTCYVFLQGSRELIQQRMRGRTGHFMAESLLDSQFDALDSPVAEPNVVCIDIDPEPAVIAANAVAALKQREFLEIR